jgi:hypothetical protein
MPKEELVNSLNTKCLLLQANAKRRACDFFKHLNTKCLFLQANAKRRAFEFFKHKMPASAGQCQKKGF